MPVPKKKSKSHDLPTKAPKRTGKKGIHPPESSLAADMVKENPAVVRATVEELTEALREEQEMELLKTPANAKKQPRQGRLQGMQDSKIEVLQSLAEDYATIRDQRQALTTEEVRLKNELLGEMHSRKRTSYVYGPVEIHIIVEKEKVRVKIAKDKEKDGE